MIHLIEAERLAEWGNASKWGFYDNVTDDLD
jgi:hypothetical protein